jgi:ubiquitin carboxyl-terminal hydrolase 34
MAHTESTSSPRNHAADENPELARKKQKISCNEGDVGASPDDPLLIEDVTDPEDLGASMANAIEIEEEATEPYINAFHPSPIPRLRDLQTRIDHNQYIDFAEFNWLSKALSNHLNATANEPHAWRRHYVEEEAELFVMLASVSHRLVITENLFEKKFDISKDKPQASFEEFICSILTLARRILPFLPDAVKTILSRRDSAQGSMRPQSLGSLYYITLAATLVSPGEPSAVTQFSGRAGTMEAVIADAPNFFLHDDVVRALAAVIRLISGAMRELMDSWLTLQNALAIFRSVIARRHNADEFPKLEAEEIMDVLCGTIRPAIAAKHPRALPDGFHESVIAFGEEMLSAHTRIHGLSSASDLYERYVKHTDDAMIPQAADNSSISTSLWRICGQNYKVLAQLLSDSWAFQTAKAFIRSDIMDVRSVGMLALKSRLVRVHNNGQKSPEGFESPVVQYAVRYMRENEITAYIFGPESHAGLITQSYDVVAFLAATLSLTDVEIDIIWRACCTSVEADFVKAAFGCLSYLAKFMDLRGLLHVADKYTSTPVSRLNGHAADMLSWWLMDLERKTSDPNRRFERQQLTLTSVRILRHIDTCQASALTNSLRHSALTQISQLAERNYPLEERAEVYKHCLPEICGFTQHATSSMDILSMYVRHDISSEEAAFIVSILPIAAAVDELCEYVGRPPRPGDLRVDAVAVRLECIIRLIALTDKEDDPSMDPRLFTQVFGASSADSHVRNAAWEKLHSMATTGNAKISGTATRMWKGFMQNFVPSLSADLASPTLVQFVALSLRQECQSEDMPPEFVNILDLPLWDAIVRFATCSPTAGVIESATGAILDLLFIFPINSRFSPASISQCHIKFVESHIERLRIVFANIDQAADSPGRREFWHGMDLLHWLLRRSRETLSPLKLTEESGALCVGDPSDHSDRITFEVQIHGPDVQPRNMPVAASAFSKVPELLAALSATLGASHIKIIAGGVDITTAGEQTLAEAGVRQSGVILVCPRFKPSDDIDKALVRAGPVEQAILAQYSSVEAFLDGPDAAAGKVVFLFQ